MSKKLKTSEKDIYKELVKLNLKLKKEANPFCETFEKNLPMIKVQLLALVSLGSEEQMKKHKDYVEKHKNQYLEINKFLSLIEEFSGKKNKKRPRSIQIILNRNKSVTIKDSNLINSVIGYLEVQTKQLYEMQNEVKHIYKKRKQKGYESLTLEFQIKLAYSHLFLGGWESFSLNSWPIENQRLFPNTEVKLLKEIFEIIDLHHSVTHYRNLLKRPFYFGKY